MPRSFLIKKKKERKSEGLQRGVYRDDACPSPPVVIVSAPAASRPSISPPTAFHRAWLPSVPAPPPPPPPPAVLTPPPVKPHLVPSMPLPPHHPHHHHHHHHHPAAEALLGHAPTSPFTPLTPLAVSLGNGYLHDVISSLPFYSQLTRLTAPPTPPTSDSSSHSDSKSDSDISDSASHHHKTPQSPPAASPVGPTSTPPSSSPADDTSDHRGNIITVDDPIINVGCNSPVGSPRRDTASPTPSNASTEAKSRGGATGFQDGITVGYTYDAFFISDGRSRKKNPSTISEPLSRARYTCNECGKDYATSSNLSRHKQTHRSAESGLAKSCPHCGKVYVSMPALSMHILTHSLRHQCTVCNKSFSRPWLLQGHMRSHTGEKPYGCAHCGKAFADRSNLRAHMQTHSAYKNYECKRCNKTFALKSYLNKHYESACFRDDAQGAIEAMDAMSVASSCEL